MKGTILAATAVLLICAYSASAGILYGLDYPMDTSLYSVDEATGTLTTIGSVGLSGVGDLTSDGVSTPWGVQSMSNSLVDIDPITGAGTLGPTITGTNSPAGGPAQSIASLAFDQTTGTLYGNTAFDFSGIPDFLYSVNTTTGAATAIGAIGSNNIFALGFSKSGQLYGVDGACNLLNISTTTGVETLVGNTGLGLAGCAAFDIASDSDGTMYLANSGDHSLYSVNLTTGATTAIGVYGSGTNVVGLAVLEAAPEPGTVVILATGIGLLVLAAGRKKLRNR